MRLRVRRRRRVAAGCERCSANAERRRAAEQLAVEMLSWPRPVDVFRRALETPGRGISGGALLSSARITLEVLRERGEHVPLIGDLPERLAVLEGVLETATLALALGEGADAR